jgi:hypothetical protein
VHIVGIERGPMFDVAATECIHSILLPYQGRDKRMHTSHISDPLNPCDDKETLANAKSRLLYLIFREENPSGLVADR